MATTLTHALDRTVTIRATPDVVFRFFTDSARWASWWGAGSSIDPQPGGAVFIRYPNGVEVSGEVVEIDSPRRLVFTYGYASRAPIPPGGSRVTITLEAHARGTRLHLTHEFEDAAVRDHHVQGWRYQLALFANIVADEVNARAGDTVDAWFGAWAIESDDERERALEAVASLDVAFRDRFGLVDGRRDLVPHIGAALRFMPGLRMQRRGSVRHCQGVVLADWVAVGADGTERGGGTNVFTLDANGKIESVTGFWNM
jgi:uncharacterized protein YndB with AHSA1/START domain